ncbi:CatB-related O-acetyltransferase [Palleronia sp.]|uniref:CatB-related O-acetyltransferase n=1 Tax=Palleronia sp. TaxID=1940284 RepID=UPI0035C850A4
MRRRPASSNADLRDVAAQGQHKWQFTVSDPDRLARAGIRVFPKVDAGHRMGGGSVRFETPSQHPSARFLPLGAYSYSQSTLDHVAFVGRYTSIARNVCVMGDEHPAGWATTSPIAYSARRRAMWHLPPPSEGLPDFDPTPAEIGIGNDVWIGQDVLLKGGILIGDGAVIAAGAIVTVDVEPYTVVGGVPARPIRPRFAPDLARRFAEIRWWDYDWTDLADLPVQDPARFIDAVARRRARLDARPDARATVRAHLARLPQE